MVQIFKRPSLFLAGGLGALFLMTAWMVNVAAHLPRIGVDLASPPDGPLIVRKIEGDSISPLPARLMSIHSIGTPGLSVSLDSTHDVVRRPEANLAPDALEVQQRLVTIARQGALGLRLSDTQGRVFTVTRSVSPSPLGIAFWSQIVTGLFGGVVGLWVIALQPRKLAAWGAGLSGVGLLGAAYPVAVIVNGEIILGGALWRGLTIANYLSTQFFAGGFVLLFALYPRPLLPVRAIAAIVVTMIGAMLVAVLAVPAPSRLIGWVNAFVIADFMIIVALIGWQWRATRRDPAGRAYLRLVGVTWTASLGVWIMATLGPQAIGREPLLVPATGFLLMIPPYAAITLGLLGGRMFDVNAWAGRLLVSALTLLALGAAETLLVFALGVEKGPATSIAFLLIGVTWLLARHRLFDRLFGRDHDRGEKLLAGAHTIVLAPDDTARRIRWRAALEQTFDPLEIETLDPPPARSMVTSGGLALDVAPPRFGLGLRLRSARGGRSLFHHHDAALAQTLTQLCDRIDVDRQAYDRGTREERARIAKDLHDDVSGRLLTGLHRSESDLMRGDIRVALSDIRSIVSGLEGQRRPLTDALADLRQESGERLASAGVALDWPADAALDDRMLDYPTYRALNSIIREVVTNVIRHSGASALRITVDISPDASRLLIDARDDGIGIGPNDENGLGLRNINARAQALGGSAVITDDGGAHIALDLPLAAAAPVEALIGEMQHQPGFRRDTAAA